MKTIKILVCALIASGFVFTSCGDDDEGGNNLPPVGGYNSADEIGAADLVAYWPLDGNGTEQISGTAPSNSVGATYASSTKGQKLVLTNGYLNFPAIASLSTTMPSMTISLWAKVTNNGGPGADGHPAMMFQLSKPNDWGGNINLMSETGWYASSVDTLIVKGFVKIQTAGGGESGQDSRNSPKPSAEDIAAGHVGNANKNSGQWAHYVITWDATTAMFKVYANGQKISNPAWESRNGGAALGLNFFTPTRPIIGTFATVIDGTAEAWQRPMNGEIDEIRVWKKVINDADINFLYQLESQGR
ncbi:hypothetical protein AM493_01475 [Flavobacterium akiainvivens]|uniref:LamG-like jellyroll fold domain-containing protein n=1 Tax=Flavobacterium akiainvivens TaxID=1202724 RepID=A0A0M8MG25_9FLAO|nr:LamG-like jellyroll fold domain-containing protein [Flavobacterium akiainvivens]KOS04858.1 hypothetical protein AM493_01475 [Flavobacterium akiainvivens]SFQ43145.1 Concanavalin A-like lectin/glucanases superfamily protein [Flavobacterium akiainvivens]